MVSKIIIATITSCIVFISGCVSGPEDMIKAFEDHRFDTSVINKIPAYDSFVRTVLANYRSFEDHFDNNVSYKAFRYIPASTNREIFHKLPEGIKVNVDSFFRAIGNRFIYGFDLFRDSSIKIYIRTGRASQKNILIEENLSYYPASSIRHREYPDKDSILNEHWQYWARFSKE